MAENYVVNNYTLIELVHLSYLLRDSFEYVHPQVKVEKENFEKRTLMAKNMLAEGNFTEKWLNNHPNEEVKKVYPQLVAYFQSIYESDAIVSRDNFKVDPEKSADFIEQTIKLYQVSEDIVKAFLTEYHKTPGLVDPRVEKCIDASFDYYRVIVNWNLFNEVIRNDNEYKKALKASNNQPSYDVNFNLNILKRLIGAFNFNKIKYNGDKVDIKGMMESTFAGFKALDGTLFKDYEEANKVTLSNEEKQKMAQDTLQKAANDSVNCIRLYEPIWRDTYKNLSEYMKENPLNAGQPQANPEANA